MTDTGSQSTESIRLDAVLGYINFSSGLPDATFQKNLNELFGSAPVEPETAEPAWRHLASRLQQRLVRLRQLSETFARAEQADHVIRLVFQSIVPAYRRHHRDLLFHQPEAAFYQPFFLARVFEAVLAASGPWEETDRIEQAVLRQLNDFVGHRPVAVLRTTQRMEPYAHERVRPIPLFIRDAGVASGRYEEIIQTALEILQNTDDDMLRQAWFDPELLDELALDPRAYDFDHPVHRRLNYQFGGWDPDHLDEQGRFRRFVLRQVTVDALLSRIDSPGDLPHDEVLFEAAAVLAGTILMASGTSGSGPDTHDSSVTTATLVRHIAAYRDRFYHGLLSDLTGVHAERLAQETQQQGQPFAGARQHLNHCLSRLKAKQLQHVYLAELFARMGYPGAAVEQVNVVPVASARMLCEIDCRLSAGQDAARNGRLAAAAEEAVAIEDLMHRGIECGALVDPWNILGFQGQFSLTPVLEDSVADHRVDDLLRIVDQLLGLYVRLSAESAAGGDPQLSETISQRLNALATWWDRHASSEVEALPKVSGARAVESAAHLAESLGVWHRAGEAAGDIAFWQQHVPAFNSPKSYAVVVETLLEKRDFPASMALLVQWAAHAEEVSLDDEDHSFHRLAESWLKTLWTTNATGAPLGMQIDVDEAWSLSRKFIDYLEANAEAIWNVPKFEIATNDERADSTRSDEETGDEEEDEDDLYAAAYDEMTYRDSTDDGMDAEILDGGPPTDYELDHEARRLGSRLAFLTTVARLWKIACIGFWTADADAHDEPERSPALGDWHAQAQANCQQLRELLASVHRFTIPAPRGTHESLAEYDRRHTVKEALISRIVAASVISADTAQWLLAAAGARHDLPKLEPWQRQAVIVIGALLRRDHQAVVAGMPELMESLRTKHTLYVPLAQGGAPEKMVETQSILHLLSQLLRELPRAGLLNETYALLTTAQEMEKNLPGGSAITSFERLFESAFTGIVGCLARAFANVEDESADGAELIDCLHRAAEPLLQRWLGHSRGVRLSVLEKARDDEDWRELVEFIQHYGHDLFTQPLLQLSRLRSILHHGVDRWLASLAEEPEPEVGQRLLDDLENGAERSLAVGKLTFVLEAVAENYATYCDYNTTTTHSDHGEALYTLLDVLRLLASYDRFAWNLKPLVDAHRVLVAEGHPSAAQAWRLEFVKRTAEIADSYQSRFDALCETHGMRLSSMADRFSERFVRPLAIDRVCALVRPAIDEGRRSQDNQAFSALVEELEEFLQAPTGSAVEMPDWLARLEEQVETVQNRGITSGTNDDMMPPIEEVILDWEEACRQIDSWQTE